MPEPGDFYLRTALNPIRSGLTGIEVQPCDRADFGGMTARPPGRGRSLFHATSLS
jgi:hypothetical protein